MACFLFFPTEGCCNTFSFIYTDLYIIIMMYGWVFFFCPANTLPHLICFFNPSLSQQCLVYPCKISLKPFFKLCGHGWFFDRFGLAFYLQVIIGAFIRLYSFYPDMLFGPGFHHYRQPARVYGIIFQLGAAHA